MITHPGDTFVALKKVIYSACFCGTVWRSIYFGVVSDSHHTREPPRKLGRVNTGRDSDAVQRHTQGARVTFWPLKSVITGCAVG